MKLVTLKGEGIAYFHRKPVLLSWAVEVRASEASKFARGLGCDAADSAEWRFEDGKPIRDTQLYYHLLARNTKVEPRGVPVVIDPVLGQVSLSAYAKLTAATGKPICLIKGRA